MPPLLLPGDRSRSRRGPVVLLVAILAGVVLLAVPARASSPTFVASTGSPAGGGWTVTAEGQVSPFAGAPSFGAIRGRLNRPIVGIAASPTGGGYWLVASDGGVFAFGDATFHGSAGGLRLNRPVVGMAATPAGDGYWLVASDGGIFTYGAATFHGSAGGLRLNRPVVGMAATPSGDGYWLVATDGGIFTYGAATFHGSAGGLRLDQPIVGMAATPSGGGYWLVASDGGVFSYGTAPFGGSMAGAGDTVIGIAAAGASSYWLASNDGTAKVYSATLPSAPTPGSPGGGGSVPGGPVVGAGPPALGVLGADSQYLAADTQAGLRWGVINVRWDLWEPQPGQMDPAFVSEMQGAVARYRAAGWTVSVDIGLQTPPSWVLGLPGGQLQDQYGGTSGSANFEYSAAVRAAATAYIDSIVAAMPGIASYRVGVSPSGEMLYPEAPANQWWAFDAIAQGRTGGLPASVSPSPMPGWVPGTPTYLGRPVTADTARAWYGWYQGALDDAHRWEIDAYRAAGYTGQLQLVMPGTGALPTTYNQRITDLLAEDSLDPAHTMNTGALWWDVLDRLPLTGTAVDISSVDDPSGTPQANGCQAGDAAVDYTASPAVIGTWSDTRWLAYLAGRHGLPVLGENGGNTSAASLPAIMQLVGSCHMSRLQWAWDWELNGGGPYASLGAYVGALPIALAAAGL